MLRLKELVNRATIVIVLALCAGLSTANAAEDRFSVELGSSGEIVTGSGTGYNFGSWYYYPNTDWLAQWFYNDIPNRDMKKVISVDLSVDVLDPAASGSIEVAVNWTSLEWPQTPATPPLPANVAHPDTEQRYIVRQTVVQRTEVRGSSSINTTFEIEAFCPQWISIDLRGQDVVVNGAIRHDCVPKAGQTPPSGARDFGDAPEGTLAYPGTTVVGLFPTCVGVGPASWIEHGGHSLYLGASSDKEADGNGGKCPTFNPNLHNQDEKQRDGDAGLIKPRAFTIVGPAGAETVGALNFIVLESLGNGCLTAIWDATIDVEVHNTSGSVAYMNILFDWNKDGKWQGMVQCPTGPVPEHVLVNFPVPAGYEGPLSALRPPNFQIGPLGGHFWARFTISDRQVPQNWTGDGVFSDGETEDYLLLTWEPLEFCKWEKDDPHKMHWPQLPDKLATGLDVDMFWAPLADDFRCTQSGPITEIHFWGSFLDDHLPEFGIDSLAFVINIYSNLPATTQTPWSRPGQLLWTREIVPYSYDFYDVSGSIKQGWFDPVSTIYLPENHRRMFQYSVCFEEDDDPFVQTQGTTYWIEIREKIDEEATHTFGWKTTEQRLQYADKAVWKHPTLGWRPLTYPTGHTHQTKALDLAFVIAGEDVADTDYGDAPDPSYATLGASNGASHIIAPGIYLGAGVDGEFDGQPDATATGDDSGSDDEDGVTFSTLVVGEAAQVNVTASVAGSLNAWIDWNSDGDWADAGEQVFVDQPLSAGVNTLVVIVPSAATSGETFARFRFSTVRGLRFEGVAADGEVEDYMIRVESAVVPVKPPLEHVKWSQPPVEYDPDSRTPTYCGWDQLAYVSKPTTSSTATWRLVADDFRCVGSMPVTTVHWWGSYQGWNGVAAPRTKPSSWRVAFWSNVPADTRYTFSRPGKLLWVVTVPADRVVEEPAGDDEFPRKPSDTAFQYLLELQSQEYFAQADYVDTQTTDRTFWISITAVYYSPQDPEFPWGWKTRPLPWMDAAVKADVRRDDLRAGITLDVTLAQPVTDSLACQRVDSYDMAFELATSPAFIKWEQAFTGLRNWAHYEDEQSMAVEGPASAAKWTQNPDTTSAGIDVDITTDIPPTWPATLGGDDFQCTATGLITGITLWGSWYEDTLSSGSPENAQFTLSIREDIPAQRSSTGYSMPGRVLWSKVFARGQFTVEPIQGLAQGYYSPANETYEQNNHRMIYKYTFRINAADAFRQTGTTAQPVVYWLTAQASLVHPPGSVATRFGWKSSTSHWNDSAVWGNGTEPFQGSWHKLAYPRNHSLATRAIDLAFAIDTEQAGGLTLRRVVADDWRCQSASPVTGLVWWGSYIGYGYQTCQCTQRLAPRKPDYFMLSLWSDAPDSTRGINHPGQKLWEYKAEQFDEVFVGFDKHPEFPTFAYQPPEPVYRYTVRLPQENWYRQDGRTNILWLSVVAVYEDSKSIVYPWGWTNHPHTAWDLSGLDTIGYWKLDETTGAVAADSSGNSNHGTVLGNAIWRPTTGWLGGALDLDGRDDYIRVDRPRGFNFAPGSFSLSAWINAREARGSWHTILEYDRGSLIGNRFGLWLDTEGRLHFRVGQTTWQSPDSLTQNQWYHVAATFDTISTTMDLYIDGQLVTTTYQRSGFTMPNLATLTIGANGTGTGEFFNGMIDDVRVFRFALSDDDVLTLAGAGPNSDAVAADFSTTDASGTWPWEELLDQTGHSEDMSFVLFTQPSTLTVQSDGVGAAAAGSEWGQPKDERK